MNSNPTDSYLRVRIRGALKTCSPLHAGDGDMSQAERDNTEDNVNTVCLDKQNHPYLPASSLRGFLRDRAQILGQDLLRRLFGYAEGNQGDNGALRIYDACWLAGPSQTKYLPYWKKERPTQLRHGIAIDSITGTVAANKLFVHELVPIGSQFILEIEADNISHGDLETLLGLLAAWDGKENSGVGQGKSRMQGQLAWTTEQVCFISAAELQLWLKQGGNTPLADYYQPLTVTPANLPGKPHRLSIDVQLQLDAPLLVNEPGLVSSDDKKPKLEFSRDAEGRALIPAASFKGLLRARARRILASLLFEALGGTHQDLKHAKRATELADRLIDQLFGKTDHRSPLWVSDLIAAAPAQPHPQFFNAIDRFTGGVAEDKLYNVKAADTGCLEGRILLEQNRLPKGDWWKGLLLLVARDALEGELAVGWGKSRGYGACRISFTTDQQAVIDSWSKLLKYLDRKKINPRNWTNALHRKIAEVIQIPTEDRPHA